MKMNLIHSGLDEQTAGERALTELQKELESIYLQRLQWIQQSKNVKDDDFDPEEAMEAAATGKKILIKRRYAVSLRTVMMIKIINYISHIVLSKISYKYRSLVLFWYVGGL